MNLKGRLMHISTKSHTTKPNENKELAAFSLSLDVMASISECQVFKTDDLDSSS